ncbi:histamine H2 receptor-like [Gigantopelta aegis]|uniref:histamine H2 receptor-like n=1 Tax=Gigantopelta aegis TaxID=1735272 RepID=UPI001B887C62|nr:histamine H2 receptor-like [Gigantopelta aegis]
MFGGNASLISLDIEYLQNSTNRHFADDLPSALNIVRGVFLLVVCVLGALFNIFIIMAIIPNRRLRTVRNILLVHLGSVGLGTCLMTVLYSVVVVFQRKWIGGIIACNAYAFLNSVFTCVCVWTISALSWDKYQTISCPLHHSLSATVRRMTCCFMSFWILGLTLSLPPLLGANEFVFVPAMGFCSLNPSHRTGMWYSLVYVSFVFYIPFCILVYCYVHIFKIARSQSGRIAATMLRMVSLIQAPIAPSNASTLNMRGTKAMGTILQLVGSFVATYIPFALTLTYSSVSGHCPDTIYISIATTLFQSAPLTNASIYGLRNKILRSSFCRFAHRTVQHYCYKDQRRGSMKSLSRKSSSNQKLSIIARKLVVQNGGKNGFRRTQSFQVPHADIEDTFAMASYPRLPRPHSFSLLSTNGHYARASDHEADL